MWFLGAYFWDGTFAFRGVTLGLGEDCKEGTWVSDNKADIVSPEDWLQLAFVEAPSVRVK